MLKSTDKVNLVSPMKSTWSIKDGVRLEFRILYNFGYGVKRPAENDSDNKINMKKYRIESY